MTLSSVVMVLCNKSNPIGQVIGADPKLGYAPPPSPIYKIKEGNVLFNALTSLFRVICIRYSNG